MEKGLQRSDKSLRSTKVVRDISESLGKLPPAALDLEEAILGALMLVRSSLNDVAGVLQPDHFYSEQHKEIYTAIQQLYLRADPVDMRTVIAQLRKNGKLELIGGSFYIAELTSKVSSAEGIEFNTRKVMEFFMKRSLIQLASSVHHEAYEDTVDVFEVIDIAEKGLQKIQDGNVSGKAEVHIKEPAFKVLQQIQERQAGRLSGIMCGYASVDRILNGHQNTQLIIVAGRPGMGKSAYAFQEAMQIAKQGIPVGFFSLEMSDIQLTERIACSEAEIDSDRVQKGALDEQEFSIITNELGKISNLPIFIDDTAGLNILELRTKARRMKMKEGVQIIFIDYLQLIRVVNPSGRPQNRDQEIGEVTRTLKIIAKELAIPVVALSQLNRSVETRGGDKRPQLSDLRESGSIEQDSDVVLFLYRPEYYKITQDENGMPTHGLCEIIVAKHRNGALDTAKLKFVGKHTKFKEWIHDGQPVDYVAQQKSPLPKEKELTTDERDTDQPF